VNGELTRKSPAVMLDLKGADTSPSVPEELAALCEGTEDVIDWSLDQVLEPYLQELHDRRLQELQVKERYLKHSLNTLISESNRKLGDYHRRLAAGEDMARAISEEEKRKEALIGRRDRRLAEIRQSQYLMRRPPEVIGVAAILPMPVADAEVAGAMARDEEVEEVAMQVTLAYERAQGRTPEDVSAEDLGFDIRSITSSPVGQERRLGGEGVRYIEVKGRATVGSVALTRNEWIKAGRFGDDYWLYIVADCKAEPQLYVLQNPAAVLRPEEELEVVRYIVRAEAWKRYAEPVEERRV